MKELIKQALENLVSHCYNSLPKHKVRLVELPVQSVGEVIKLSTDFNIPENSKLITTYNNKFPANTIRIEFYEEYKPSEKEKIVDTSLLFNAMYYDWVKEILLSQGYVEKYPNGIKDITRSSWRGSLNNNTAWNIYKDYNPIDGHCYSGKGLNAFVGFFSFNFKK